MQFNILNNNIIEYLRFLDQKSKNFVRCRYPVSDLVPIRNKLTVNKAVEIVLNNAKCNEPNF